MISCEVLKFYNFFLIFKYRNMYRNYYNLFYMKNKQFLFKIDQMQKYQLNESKCKKNVRIYCSIIIVNKKFDIINIYFSFVLKNK